MNRHPHFFSRDIEGFGAKIPFVVTTLIQKLRELDAKKIQGIFRLSGSIDVIKQLQDELDEGFVKDWKPYNGITISCALKTYFRYSPTPLMTFEKYDEFMSAASLPNEEDFLAKIKELCFSLPKTRLLTLVYLINYLHEVDANSEVNKMKANNLAICLAPNILRSVSTANAAADNPQQNKIVTALIEHSLEFFSEVGFPPPVLMSIEEIAIMKNSYINETDIDLMVQRANYRKESLISYTPPECINDSNFKRPTRIVNAKKKKRQSNIQAEE